jgi:hypothetical protein
LLYYNFRHSVLNSQYRIDDVVCTVFRLGAL